MLKVGVVCHDEGGSQLVSNWVLGTNKYDYVYSLAGPAVKIFRENLSVENILELGQLVNHCDLLICGTSWESDLEKSAIKSFKDNGKKTVAILDHWVNYKERFQYQNNQVLPDEIWVADDYAQDIASAIFMDTPIKNIGNPYFSKIKDELSISSAIEESERTALYVCEPIKEHALRQEGNERFWGYTEEDALNYFLDNLSNIPIDIREIIIRPHPSEPLNKYNWALDRKDLNIKIGGKESLVREILTSTCVIGCESMAMVIGLLAEKTVLSSIPPNGRECVLPHKEIIPIKSLVQQVESGV
ncbi:hypothetical protein OAK61_01655 [Gammaproteobacteria bacterium]|nr:hypothetical protein [Gammaproteobacteria bacterium]